MELQPSLGAVDVLHGVQAESVHAHAHPLVRGLSQGPEGSGRRCGADGAIVQIRHPAAERALELHLGRSAEKYVLRIFVAEGKRLAECQDVRALGSSPFRSAVPGSIRCAHQHSPGRVRIESYLINIRACPVHADGLSGLAYPEEHLYRGVGIGVLGGPVGRGHGHGLRSPGEIHLEMEPAGITYLSHGHVVPFAGIVGTEHGELACGDVRGRIGGDVEPAELVGRGPFFGLGEPDIPLAGMVQHIVHIDFYAPVVCGVDQGLEVGLGAEFRVDGGVVLHVVAVIGICRMGGREPYRGHPESVEIVQSGLDAVEIAYAVAVAVCEAVDKQLVGDIPLLLPCGVGRTFECLLSGRIVFFSAGQAKRGRHQYTEKPFHRI